MSAALGLDADRLDIVIMQMVRLVREGENLIEVEASNADQPDCRWYSGAGIHRPVWLWEPAGAAGAHASRAGASHSVLPPESAG